MFMGIFLQFPLINDTPLYSTQVQLIFSFIKSTQKNVIGNLWENYIQPNNVIFMEQMKQSKNTQYAKLLENLRTKNILKLNFEILKTCFPSNLNVNLIDDPRKVVTFIVPWNKLWNATNHYMIDIHSIMLKQKCYVIVAINTLKKAQYAMTSKTL